MPEPIVDCHSHVFNAEDLPIDGFIKKLSTVPDILTGIVSVPLDRLAQWVATSADHEAAYLASLLSPGSALESGAVAPPPQSGSALVSDEELDNLFVLQWEQRGLLDRSEVGPAGLEAGAEPDALLVAGITRPEAAQDRAELEAWLRSVADQDLEESLAEDALEGPRDWAARIKATKQAVRRYVDALRLITKDRHLIAADLAATYPAVDLFVPALVDFEYTASDSPSAPVTSQVRIHSLLSRVSVLGRIPGASHVRIHPLVGYCPHREVATSELHGWSPSAGEDNRYVPYADPGTASPDDLYRPGIEYDPARARALRPAVPWESDPLALEGVTRSLDVVRHAVEQGGFVGVKIYPPAGYLPLGNATKFGQDKGERLDAALRALYGYCLRMDVPILAHANHSNAFEKGYDDLAGPGGWERVLDEFPELRVCFGHFGHLHGVGAQAGQPAAESWVVRFVRLMDDHPHVYADVGNSQLPVSPAYRARYLDLMRHLLGPASPSDVQARRRERVMYGSDFWMNTLAPAHREYLTTFQSEVAAAFDESTCGQFFGGNALRWLGLADGGASQPENLNRQRLVAFYGAQPLPAWLDS